MTPCISKVQAAIKKLGADAALITDMADIRYLSGFTGSTAFLLIENETCVFFTDGRYTLQAKEQVHPQIEQVIVKTYQDVFKDYTSKYKRVLLQASCNLGTADSVKKSGADIIVDNDDLLKTMRMVKTDDEISLITAQYALAAKSFKDSLNSFCIGSSEREWAAVLEYNIKKNGASGVSFETIVASGFRGAMPHGTASSKIIEKNEPVIIDFGSQLGYTSDYTRMIYGGCDKNIMSVINIVKDALLKSIDAIKAGVSCKDIDAVARDYISSKGYGEYFNHSLGHGVGLNVHELPVLNPKSSYIIEEGMVFTIEPGIYLPNKFGVRLEDTVVVYSSGFEVISSYLEDYIYLPK